MSVSQGMMCLFSLLSRGGRSCDISTDHMGSDWSVSV